MKDEAVKKEQPANFEGAMKRLTEIVQSLEKGDFPLEASLSLFEEGVHLAGYSQEKLDAAEKRVEKLIAVRANGDTETTPFRVHGEE